MGVSRRLWPKLAFPSRAREFSFGAPLAAAQQHCPHCDQRPQTSTSLQEACRHQAGRRCASWYVAMTKSNTLQAWSQKTSLIWSKGRRAPSSETRQVSNSWNCVWRPRVEASEHHACIHPEADGCRNIHQAPRKLPEIPGAIGRLKKELYGTKQAVLGWHKKHVKEMGGLGFDQVPAEPCMLRKMVGREAVVGVLVHVDGLLVSLEGKKELERFVKELGENVSIKDLGEVSFDMACHITRQRARFGWISICFPRLSPGKTSSPRWASCRWRWTVTASYPRLGLGFRVRVQGSG